MAVLDVQRAMSLEPAAHRHTNTGTRTQTHGRVAAQEAVGRNGGAIAENGREATKNVCVEASTCRLLILGFSPSADVGKSERSERGAAVERGNSTSGLLALTTLSECELRLKSSDAQTQHREGWQPAKKGNCSTPVFASFFAATMSSREIKSRQIVVVVVQ